MPYFGPPADLDSPVWSAALNKWLPKAPILKTKPLVKVYKAASQSIANTTFSILTFDSERYDTDAMHDTGATALTGTVAKAAASTTVTGTGTSFLSQVLPGDQITVPGTANELRTVAAVASNVSLTVSVAFANNATGQTATRQNDPRLKIVTPGVYRIHVWTEMAASAVGDRSLYLRLNGGATAGVDLWLESKKGTAVNTGMNLPVEHKCVANDYWECLYYQDSGAPRSVVATFSAEYLGAG